MRRLATLAVLGMLGTALLVSSAFAQGSLGIDGQKDRNQQGTKIGYQLSADSTIKLVKDGQPLPVSDAARDRDYTQVKNLIGPINVAPGGSATSTAAVALGEYTSLLVMFSWNLAAAADSDSVAFGLSFIGKLSTDMNDGFDFLVTTPNDSAWFYRADTAFAAITTASQVGYICKAPTVFVVSPNKATMTGLAGAASGGEVVAPNAGGNFVYDLYPTTVNGNLLSTRTRPYRLPPNKIIWSDGHNGVCFVLSNAGGAPFKFSHLAVQVQNLDRNKTYNNLKVDVWAKVN
jgi:hypothetical protein